MIYAAAVFAVFLIRILGVAAGTVRILVTNRGMEWSSAVLGFAEVLVYVVGMGLVVRDLTDIPMLLSYCLGFSVGNIVGIRIEQRMALGYVSLRAMSSSAGQAIANALREKGFGATLSHGEGRNGAVGIVTAVVSRKQSREAIKLIHAIDRDAFMVVDEARAVSRGWLPTNIGGSPVSTAPPTPSFNLDVTPPSAEEEPDSIPEEAENRDESPTPAGAVPAQQGA
ncbi:MAG: DUF5698 domain-containing protein [Dehalococcoidia bacterium]|nr:DUF5698 domain-containing protein [Dehalococcoidia bacterium]